MLTYKGQHCWLPNLLRLLIIWDFIVFSLSFSNKPQKSTLANFNQNDFAELKERLNKQALGMAGDSVTLGSSVRNLQKISLHEDMLGSHIITSATFCLSE